MSESSIPKPLQRPGTFHQEHSHVFPDPRTPNPGSTQTPDNTIKRLIVLCDGTWKSSDSGQPEYATNVTLLSRALDCVDQRAGKEIQQIVYYQAGLGSGELLKTQYLAAGALGFGLDTNVRECYAYLASNYQRGCRDTEHQVDTPDDEIFLFGFSRGAYTVRALAGFIGQVGLLTKRGMNDFAEIYSEYKKGKESFEKYTQQRIAESPDRIPWEAQHLVTIKAITIMDCVGSIGLPENWLVKKLNWNKAFGFYDTSLGPSIENAFHALALEEKRAPFTPTLFHIPEQKPGDEPPLLTISKTNSFRDNIPLSNKRVNLVQTWFCGVHSNVGGGYKNHKQSDIVLAWIVDNMQPFLKFDETYLDIICAQTGTDSALRTIKDDEQPWWSKILSWWPPTDNSPIVARGSSGWWLGDIYDSFEGIFNLTWPKPRTPGQYKLEGATNETIHPSVRYRYQNDILWRRQFTKGHNIKPEQDRKTGKWYWKVDNSDITIDEEDIYNVGTYTTDLMQIRLAGNEARRTELREWLER